MCALVLCAAAGFFFAGCKSVPKAPAVSVNTVDMLDSEGAMYIHIPAEENRELIELLLRNFYKQLDENNARLAASKIDGVYASLGSKKHKKRFQLAVEGKFPKSVHSMLKKHGFTEEFYNAASLSEQDSASQYAYFQNGSVQIAFPSENQTVCSQNVKPVLDMFNCEKQSLALSEPFRQDWKNSDLYSWISEDVPSIHFYIVRPQSFLTNLIGTDISSKVFKLVYAKGNFAKLPNSKYELTLELDFQDAKYIRPATSLLSLALGLTDSELTMTSPTHVVLRGVHLSAQQLVKMLGV